MTDVLYKPSEWQQRFHDLTKLGVRHALGAGAAGPGKTTCLLFDAVDQIMIEHERCAGVVGADGKVKRHKHHLEWGASKGWVLHLRRTRLQLEQTIQLAKRAFAVMDSGVQWNEARSTFTFTSGLKYQFGHCKDPNDFENYMSFEFSAIYFDELTQFDEEQYDQICTRLRTTDPVLRLLLKVRSMSNPLMRRDAGESYTVKDPNWVRRRFVDPDRNGNHIFWKKIRMSDGTVEKIGTVYMPARLSANPDKAFVRQYEITLRDQPTHIQKALLEGDWYVTVGSFFAEYWQAALHVCKPFKCSPDYRFFRSMDWGFKSPGCIGWWALDDDGTLFCIKEVKFKGKTDAEVAEVVRVVEIDLKLWDEKRNESLITGVADTQLWEQRGDSGESKAEVFRRKGVEWRPADKKSRQTNAGHIIKRLVDHDFGTKTPGLVFFDTCKYCVATIPSIQTSSTNPEEPQDGGDDHGYDMVAYACAYASKGKQMIPAKREPKEPWEEEDDRVHTRRRGRHGYGQELC